MDTIHQEFHQPTLAELQHAHANNYYDPLSDPRWQNIYPPSHLADDAWMTFRQAEDTLSSTSSSSDGSYAHSVYSGSSDLSNPLNFQHLINQPSPAAAATGAYSPAHSSGPFAPTSALPPTSSNRHSSSSAEELSAWMYPHDPNGGSPYHQQAPPSSNPYGGGRDSGEWDSYSSGGEEPYPSYPAQYNPFGAQNQNEHGHHQQQQGSYNMTHGMMNDLSSPSSYHSSTSPGGGPNNPASSKPPAMYSPPRSGGYSSYSGPTSATGAGAHGQGGSRLTPELGQLSISHTMRNSSYSNSMASPIENGSGGPGPSRHNRGVTSPSHSTGPSAASSPYGRPVQHRYPQTQQSHQHTTSSGSAASNSSHSQPPSYSPTGLSNPSSSTTGKIFGTSQSISLPPLCHAVPIPPSSKPIFATSSTSLEQQHAHAEERRKKKEMVAGTPTHPDIPRPANVSAPVPVPHLIKKSRGRQVPSVSAVSNSRSRERDGEDTKSPISPMTVQNAGYFGHPAGSDGEGYDEMGARISAGSGHGPRSLFGYQPAMPPHSLDTSMGLGGMYAHQHQHHHAAGSTSPVSSPATSLSSRRTAGDDNTTQAQTVYASAPVPASQAQDIEADLRTRPFVCTVEGCGKAYIRAEHLKRHVRSIHTNDKPFDCPFAGCGREFSRYDNLCQHYKGVHGPTNTGALKAAQAQMHAAQQRAQ